jgi:hypothetical protein
MSKMLAVVSAMRWLPLPWLDRNSTRQAARGNVRWRRDGWVLGAADEERRAELAERNGERECGGGKRCAAEDREVNIFPHSKDDAPSDDAA